MSKWLLLLSTIVLNLFVFVSCSALKDERRAEELSEQVDALRTELIEARNNGNDVLAEYLQEEIAELNRNLVQSSAHSADRYEHEKIIVGAVGR